MLQRLKMSPHGGGLLMSEMRVFLTMIDSTSRDAELESRSCRMDWMAVELLLDGHWRYTYLGGMARAITTTTTTTRAFASIVDVERMMCLIISNVGQSTEFEAALWNIS